MADPNPEMSIDVAEMWRYWDSFHNGSYVYQRAIRAWHDFKKSKLFRKNPTPEQIMLRAAYRAMLRGKKLVAPEFFKHLKGGASND